MPSEVDGVLLNRQVTRRPVRPTTKNVVDFPARHHDRVCGRPGGLNCETNQPSGGTTMTREENANKISTQVSLDRTAA